MRHTAQVSYLYSLYFWICAKPLEQITGVAEFRSSLGTLSHSLTLVSFPWEMNILV